MALKLTTKNKCSFKIFYQIAMSSICINKVSYKPILRVCKAASVAGALTFREQEKKVREGK